MDSDLYTKQTFLRQQIIDEGYSGEDFMNYLISLKEDGDNIENWSMDELKDVVKKFKRAASGQSDPPVEKSPEPVKQAPAPAPVAQKTTVSQVPAQTASTITTSSAPPAAAATTTAVPAAAAPAAAAAAAATSHAEDESKALTQSKSAGDATGFLVKGKDVTGEFQAQIDCQTAPPNELLTMKNLEINVRTYEKKQGGFFTASYITYRIQTFPANWDVTRRFNDFYWLHETLTKLYPGYAIPPVAKKTATRNYQQLFIQKRMAFLEKFLNKITKSPELRNCKYLQGFLQLQNEKDFKNLQKETEKIPKVLKLDKLTTMSGKVELELNDKINNYLTRTSEFMTNSETIYKKIRQLSKQLIMDYDQLSSTLYNMGDCFSQLYQHSNFFNQHVAEPDQNQLLNDMYVTMNNMKVSWGNALVSQIKLIQENLGNFFKYYHYENSSIKEVVRQRDVMYKEYLAKNKHLQDRKERLFQMQNVLNWEIPSDVLKQHDKDKVLKDKKLAFELMLPKDTQVDFEMRNSCAYYTRVAYQEVKRLLTDRVKDYSDHFMNFGKLQTDNITELHILWADTMTNLQSIGVGKKVKLIERVRQKEDKGEELIE